MYFFHEVFFSKKNCLFQTTADFLKKTILLIVFQKHIFLSNKIFLHTKTVFKQKSTASIKMLIFLKILI